MKKIYFIDTMIDDFMEYVKRFDNCKNYIHGLELLQLAKYYAKNNRVYITDRGQTVTDYNKIIAIENEGK